MIIVDLYGRVSTLEQASEGYSLGEQEERMRKYCESQGWIINDVLMDGGYSGANLKRPGIEKVIEDAQSHKINKVVVYKLDRLSRSQKDTLYLIEDIFTANGVDFVSMTEAFSSGTPFGRATLGLMSVFAQLEREAIKERMIMGKDARVKSGKYHAGGNLPTGYNVINGGLIANEDEADTVRWIFEEFASGKSANSIAIELHRMRFKRDSWNSYDVRKILRNPVYNGYHRYKGEIYKLDEFERIVPQETFDAVQSILEKENNKRPQTAYPHVTLFGGMVWCAKCGGRMVARSSYDWKGKLIRRYGCTRHFFYTQHKREEDCVKKQISNDALNKIVIDEIRKLQIEGRIERKENIDSGSEEKRIKKRLSSIDSQIDKIVDLYSVGKFDIEKLNEKIDNLNREKHNLEKELEDCEKKKPRLSTEETELCFESFNQIIDSCGDDYMELYQIVRTLIQSITIDVETEEITIQWNI